MTKVLHIQQLSDYSEATTPAGESSSRAKLLVPSGAIGCYSLDVSEVPKRYLTQALPAMLEDHLVDDIETQHFNHSTYKRNANLQVLVASDEMMQQWLDSASSCGFQVDGIYPDFYAIPFEEGHPSLFVKEDYAIVRTGEHAGFSGSTVEVLTILSLMEGVSVVDCYSEESIPANESIQTVFKPAIDDFNVDSHAINLCSGEYDAKPQAQNPYAGFMVPMALAACLMAVIAVNNWAQTQYFNSQADLIEPKVEQDYRRLFGENASAGWQARASYQGRLAQAQLNSPELSHWQLLKNINDAISSCRSCQIDNISFKDNSASLTVKTEGSQPLVSSLESSGSLLIDSKETQQNALLLTLKMAGA